MQSGSPAAKCSASATPAQSLFAFLVSVIEMRKAEHTAVAQKLQKIPAEFAARTT